MKISREDVLYVAELAHLELTEAEVDTYRNQLDSILTYIEKLKELDVAGVEPMAQVLFGSVGTGAARVDAEANPALRDDTPRPSGVGEAVLAGAPDASKPFFRVPKVIDR